MFKRVIVIILFLSAHTGTYAQEPPPQKKFEDDILIPPESKPDSLQHLLHHFGTFEGHIRTYFMSTVNRESGTHYYALAAGGGLAYYSPVIRNFQVGLSGSMTFKLASSPLGPESGYPNRYELGLFDVTDPRNGDDLDRLEKLYLRYYLNVGKRSFAQLGRFSVRTPLVNLQDGRMGPNLQEGFWFQFNENAKLRASGGWLWKTSPRGTVDWYNIGESVGVYPNGRAVNGEPASYFQHIKSKSILIANLDWRPARGLDYHYWNYYADHLFNVALHEIEASKKTAAVTWSGGIQYLWEQSLSDPALPVENQYIGPDEQAHIFSGRLAVVRNKDSSEWSLNYTRITAHGRFLFPREWGIEPLYTFNSRERNEGAGDVHAVMADHQRKLDKAGRSSIRLLAGVYRMPPLNDPRLNKYAMPSYYQLGLHGHYRFKGFLYGLEARMIYTYKGNLDRQGEYRPLLAHNKTDMHHLSVIMDYLF